MAGTTVALAVTVTRPLPGTVGHWILQRDVATAVLLGRTAGNGPGLFECVEQGDQFFAAPALIHAAANRRPLDLSSLLVPPHLGDGLDLCYVKDTGRAIALLQLADRLNYRTYNVASGRLTTNADIIDAGRNVDPNVELELPDGAGRPGNPLDITRLHDDTGYRSEFDTARAAADYIAWLRAGNNR